VADNGYQGNLQVFPERAAPEFYVDNVTIAGSAVTVLLEMGLAHPAPPGMPQPVRPQARVFMSPQHAKLLAKTLSQQMQRWEELNGTIMLPTEVLDSLGLSNEW
jgi:hypothetical protein